VIPAWGTSEFQLTVAQPGRALRLGRSYVRSNRASQTIARICK
jgi:hypothetical protein